MNLMHTQLRKERATQEKGAERNSVGNQDHALRHIEAGLVHFYMRILRLWRNRIRTVSIYTPGQDGPSRTQTILFLHTSSRMLSEPRGVPSLSSHAETRPGNSLAAAPGVNDRAAYVHRANIHLHAHETVRARMQIYSYDDKYFEQQ